ncbi:MAG: zinc ribbon domain-containing protein [Chloroflexota bacterium]|nr:zinc ribbon domain-containing protein [Chloroflexota bacterium]
MPTYEYECSDCKQRFDRVQSFNDEPIRVCPHCGGPTRRVIHASGVIFKGSGWYINDSRKPAATGSSTATASKTAEGGDKAANGDKPATPGDGKVAPAPDTAVAKPAEPSKAAPAGEP